MATRVANRLSEEYCNKRSFCACLAKVNLREALGRTSRPYKIISQYTCGYLSALRLAGLTVGKRWPSGMI